MRTTKSFFISVITCIVFFLCGATSIFADPNMTSAGELSTYDEEYQYSSTVRTSYISIIQDKGLYTLISSGVLSTNEVDNDCSSSSITTSGSLVMLDDIEYVITSSGVLESIDFNNFNNSITTSGTLTSQE